MEESLITPDLEARVGVLSEPLTIEVTPLVVRRLREMLGRDTTLDPEPEEGATAPSALLVMPDAGRELSPLPGLPESSLVTGEEWEQRRPIRVGETLHAANRLADLAERFGSRLGHTLSVRHEWLFSDRSGEVVAVARRSMAYYARDTLRPREDGARPSAPPVPLAEHPGAEARSAREGDPLPSRLLTPALEQVIRYCAVTWNITPIFFDPEAARRAGLPGTIIPGPLKMAIQADRLIAWAGEEALVESIRSAFRRPDTPGRPLLLGGAVTTVEQDAAARRLHCEIWIVNDSGERSAVGAAVIRLPA